MKDIFPFENEIPAAMLVGIPVASKNYLRNGRVDHWRGPFREVQSPILVRTSTGLSQKRIGYVPSMDEEASLNILREARGAFDNGTGEWIAMSTGERIERFNAFLGVLESAREEIVRLLQWEIGKTARESQNEFDRAVSYARSCFERASEYTQAKGSIIEKNGISGRLERTPRGTVLVMGPFNYPLFETMSALAPALLSGNTVIIKPPRLGCLLFQHILKPIGDIFPRGVINFVYGNGKRIIPPLIASGGIDVFYFIGTSSVAAYLHGLHPKPHRLTCILGLEAKNPAIILPDADIETAATECAKGALTFNGQRCAALKIFFVHRSIAVEFNERLKHLVAAFRYGMPWEDNVVITPLAEGDRAEYLSGLVDDALELGADVINEGGGESAGTFFCPAVLYPASLNMRVCREEQFGPVMPIVPYDTIDQPIRYITESNYGQQASVFGQNRSSLAQMVNFLVHHVSRVNINCQCQRSPDTVPFTGRKDSAQGSLSISEAVEAFTVPTFIATKTDSGDIDVICDRTSRKS
ncbi:MAG: aldehyde dehydrogenase family protein [Syntrophorhabdaceae bacterium]|nr:aldehyde dehydrogenase family protein [Syntrophorhabdaceae bacterium]